MVSGGALNSTQTKPKGKQKGGNRRGRVVKGEKEMEKGKGGRECKGETEIGKGEEQRGGRSGMRGREGKRRLWSTMLMAGIALTQRLQ